MVPLGISDEESQHQPSSHDANTAATPMTGILGYNWNACVDDVHRTSSLCNYLALERRLLDLHCNCAEESTGLMVKLTQSRENCGVWVHQSRTDQEGSPPTTSSHKTNNATRYDVRRTKPSLRSISNILDMERRDDAIVFQSRTDGTKAGVELDSNQCACCLKHHNRWRESRPYVNSIVQLQKKVIK